MWRSRLVLVNGWDAARSTAVAWIGAVVGISIAARASAGWVAALAASPERIREGKLWYLVSSGMLVDQPVVLSLVCFVALATVALVVCDGPIFWRAAFLGQVSATLVVYALVGVIRWVVPTALSSVVVAPDFGVSTVSAAWLAAIAASLWRRRGRTALGKCSIVCSCAAVGLFAYTVRPEIGILSSEHLVAFGLGLTALAPRFWSRVPFALWRRIRTSFRCAAAPRWRARPAALIAAAVPIAVAVAAAPAALATLRSEIDSHLPPSVERCARDWNRRSGAPMFLLANDQAALLRVSTVRMTVRRDFGAYARPPVWAAYCRIAIRRRDSGSVVLGRWHAGEIDEWNVSTTKVGPPARFRINARATPNGRLVLIPRRRRGLALS